MPAFDYLTIKENPTFSFYMSPAVEGSATDDQHVIDFDPDQWEILDVVRPEAEAMREACAAGNLAAVQSVLRGKPLPERRWSLGKYGLVINITSLFFLTPIWFFAFWPAATPVKPDTMNWAVVMYGGMMIWSLVYYVVWARHSYEGPVVIVKRDGN